MISNNDATELCITKGQEAYVVGWDAIQGPQIQNVLETLYLKLKNPPKTINLPHLPENVIPMTRTSKSIKCSLPNDHEINIIRQQVNVLPNFSMTDYASQGKTRPYNVVNLSHCKNFQSIYTHLSQSSSAAGTLIIQGFNSAKITQGLSGHLHQEFRELNILDEITMKIYEGHISTSFAEPLQNTMIYKYQNKIQIKNNKNSWHNATKCTDTEISIKIPKKDEAWNLNMYKNIFDTTNIIKENKIVQQEFNSQKIIKNINNNELFLTSVIPNNFCN